jgi:Flp pilus assembly pilin Flp
MLKAMWSYLKDERGIETLEWIAVGAVIVGAAFVIYPGTLQGQLTTAITNLGGAIQGAVPAAP